MNVKTNILIITSLISFGIGYAMQDSNKADFQSMCGRMFISKTNDTLPIFYPGTSNNCPKQEIKFTVPPCTNIKIVAKPDPNFFGISFKHNKKRYEIIYDRRVAEPVGVPIFRKHRSKAQKKNKMAISYLLNQPDLNLK